MKYYVLGFIFNSEGYMVQLIRKNRPEWQAGRLNGIGGKIEPNENPLEAMVRECREEAGVTINEWDLFTVMEGGDFKVWVFRAFDDVAFKAVRSKTDEIITAHYSNDISTYEKVISNLKWLIPLARNKDGGIKFPVYVYYGNPEGKNNVQQVSV